MSGPDATRAGGPRPDFIVIGAMKCATSSLHDQLAANPGVFMSDPKEPCYFSDDAVFARGWSWYADLFRNAPAGALRGESSTHYTKLPTHPDTVARLHAALPDVKLVYVVRDPIERLVSQYVHEWTERAVEGGIEHAIGELPRLVDYGRYAYQLRPYLEAFGAERVLLVFFERLSGDPARELARIGRFLGAGTPLIAPPDDAARNVSAERLRKPPLHGILWGSAASDAIRRRLVPARLRAWVKERYRAPDRPTLTDETRGALAARFDPDLSELGEWLGVHLDSAGFRAQAERTTGDWSAPTRERFPGTPDAADDA